MSAHRIAPRPAVWHRLSRGLARHWFPLAAAAVLLGLAAAVAVIVATR